MGPIVPLEPSFHLFILLPYEIRRRIYIIATPPRVVHVKEGYEVPDHVEFRTVRKNCGSDCESFKMEFAFRIFLQKYGNDCFLHQQQLHPDIAYFACHWRSRIPFRAGPYKQNHLESYGFTSNGRYQPWAPTSSTPELPLSWLTSHPDVAFELLRKSYLYSEAPIPPLLHTFLESRQTLLSFGYQLTFSTRTYGPRTWFHFKRDKLYLVKRAQFEGTHGGESYHDLLSGGPWDVGPFTSQDLQRVERLVLRGSSCYEDFLRQNSMANLMCLMPNLQEVFWEEWGPDDMVAFCGSVRTTCKAPQDSATGARHEPKSTWTCVPAEDIDAISIYFCPFWVDYYCSYLPSCGASHHLFNYYKRRHPKSISYFQYCAEQLNYKLMSQETSGPPGSRPGHQSRVKFCHAHTCSELIARKFVDSRRIFWRFFMEMQHMYAACSSLSSFDAEAIVSAGLPDFLVSMMAKWPSFKEAQRLGFNPLFGRDDFCPDVINVQAWLAATIEVAEPTLEEL